MNSEQYNARPRIWISYPWATREERDFTYLVTQLESRSIEASYDSLQVLPDIKLQDRILQRLLSIGFDGWLYILTHQVLAQRSCADQLIAAIDLTVQRMGPNFPTLGLLHGISTQHVPLALRVRPCLSLGDPDWIRQVSNALKERAASKCKMVRIETRFIWRVHSCWGGDSSKTAVEVGTYGERIPYWRFALPKSAQPVQWGVGAAESKDISSVRLGVANGSGKCGNQSVIWFGAANKVSNVESAFVVFSGPLPEFVCFGPAESFLGPPGKVEVFQTDRNRPLLVTSE